MKYNSNKSNNFCYLKLKVDWNLLSMGKTNHEWMNDYEDSFLAHLEIMFSLKTAACTNFINILFKNPKSYTQHNLFPPIEIAPRFLHS